MVARLCCTERKVIAFLYNTIPVLKSCNFFIKLDFCFELFGKGVHDRLFNGG